MNSIDLLKKFDLFDELWTPKIISEVNEQYVKLAKIDGEFEWHSHQNEDELFFVVKGNLTLRFRDGEVNLKAGQMYCVPKATEHLPIAHEETWVMLIEPKSTKHTGEIESDKTVDIKNQEWI